METTQVSASIDHGEPAGSRAAPQRSVDLRVGTAQSAIGYILGSLGACLILLSRDLDVGRGELAWLSAGFGGALIVVGVVGPWLLHAGALNVLRASAGAVAVGAVGLAVARSIIVAQAGALALGIGGAGIVLASAALLSGRRAAARIAMVTAASMLAGVCGPLLISVVDATSGHGRLALLVPLPALLWLVATSMAAPSPGEVASAPAAPAVPGGLAGGAWARVGASWLCIVLAVAAEFAFHLWGAARLQDSGLGASAAAAAAAAFPLGMATGRFAAPLFIGRAPVVTLGAALGIAGALGMAAPTGPVLATTALGVAGLGIALLYPVTLAKLVAIPALGLRQGAALGAAASGTAALAAPAAVHALAAATSLGTSFIAVAGVLALLVALERRIG
jgi:hypothetical protein